MDKVWIILIVVAVIIIAALIALYIVGNKLKRRQDNSEAQMKEAAQTVSILVIDKKKMKLKDANLPKIVVDQTPKLMRASKVPIVKAKIGPKVMSLVCDAKIFDSIPIKKEIKAVISGIYIMNVKGLRSGLDTNKVKVGLFKKLTSKFKK